MGISSLRVSSLLFRDVVAEFTLPPRGLNCLTGETGAGKSLLMNALGLLTGVKVDWKVAQDAQVEGVFDEGFVVRRTLRAKSRASTCSVDGRKVSLAELAETMRGKVEILGQGSFVRMYDEGTHAAFLDAFGGLVEQREAFSRLFYRRQDVERRLLELRLDKEKFNRERDLMQYQLKELEELALSEGEEGRLAQRKDALSRSEVVREGVSGALECVEGDGGALERVERALSDLRRAELAWEEELDLLDGAVTRLRELVRLLGDRLDTLETYPGEMDEINARLFAIARAKEKYGLDALGLVKREEELRRLLAGDGGFGDEGSLARELESLDARLDASAEALSGGRRKAARALESEVAAVLGGLDMGYVKFTVAVESAERGPSGDDAVCFLLVAVPGSKPGPLARVASGGELSRIMLALKAVLAAFERPATLVFDEVDQGIGGKAAEVVGLKLHELAEDFQVVVVTHLPQVAALADNHMVVEKEEGGKRANVRRVKGEERVTEIARMLSGRDITEEALENARRMLQLQ